MITVTSLTKPSSGLPSQKVMPNTKGKTVFVCNSCGNEYPKWEGRCPSCGEWATLSEFQVAPRNGRQASTAWINSANNSAVELANVSTDELPRIALSSTEVSRVLGGGIVPGSLILIAGDPGIGKSTLLLDLAAEVAQDIGPTLYISGEESASQVKLRAQRLGISGENLFILTITNIEDILNHIDKQSPVLAVVDSIQTVHSDSLPSEPGSVAQIRECARRLMEWAKARNVPVIMTGHVTKGGDIAGPRVLEHMVDVVLYMEGDPISSWRLLRGVKNRFGSTNEVGVFEMTSNGLQEVTDPSRSLLSERANGAVGSAIVPVLEGSRPILVEIQALTSPSVLPTPRRVATGIDHNRLLLASAVLTRRVGVPLSNQDIVANATGGLKISEPAADLGVALAIVSSYRNVPVDAGTAAVGEIGLSGEVRSVPQLERRLREVSRLGFKRCLISGNTKGSINDIGNLELIPVPNLVAAVNACIAIEPRNSEAKSAQRGV